jgi:hypothetical protein
MEGLREESRFLGDAAILMGGKKNGTEARTWRHVCLDACFRGAYGAVWPEGAHTVHTGTNTPMQKAPASGPQVIFSNIGPNVTNAYNDTTGYYILGPNNSVGLSEQAIGVPFTPRTSSHVTQLLVAVQWISGTSLVNVGLYSDSGGTVGSLLASAQSSAIPTFGTCCKVVDVTIPSTAISGGSQYWIVAWSDDTNAPDFTGVFAASNLANIAGDVAQGGWFSFTTNTPAAAARGTIP